MNGERVVKQTVMLSPIVAPRGLVTGERLSVDEFLRRWEELPELKNAELIDGVVYEARRSRMPFSAFCRRTADSPGAKGPWAPAPPNWRSKSA